MHRTAIEEFGFTVMNGVLSDVDIRRLTEGLSQESLPRSRAGIRHALRSPSVRQIAHDARVIKIAEDILGGGAIPFRATLFDKSSDSNWLVVWHQDTALPLRRRSEAPDWGPWSVKKGVTYAHAPARALETVVALRIHLDDSSADNGPLRVLPNTHMLGCLSEAAIRELASRVKPETCLVARGGILAMRPLIVHASSKSTSDTSRRVLHIEYTSSLHLADRMELAIA